MLLFYPRETGQAERVYMIQWFENDLRPNSRISKRAWSRVKFRVHCGNQTVKWKENHNQPHRRRHPQLSNQTQQTVNWISYVQSHRHLFWLLYMLLGGDECECKNENYACVLVLLTAATSTLALDWNDWFCMWENLPVCPGFRAVMYETQLFPWLLKGEQPVEPGFLTSKGLLHWFPERIIIFCLIMISEIFTFLCQNFNRKIFWMV